MPKNLDYSVILLSGWHEHWHTKSTLYCLSPMNWPNLMMASGVGSTSSTSGRSNNLGGLNVIIGEGAKSLEVSHNFSAAVTWTHPRRPRTSTSSLQCIGCSAGVKASHSICAERPGHCMAAPKTAPSKRSSTRRFSVPSTRSQGRAINETSSTFPQSILDEHERTSSSFLRLSLLLLPLPWRWTCETPPEEDDTSSLFPSRLAACTVGPWTSFAAAASRSRTLLILNDLRGDRRWLNHTNYTDLAK